MEIGSSDLWDRLALLLNNQTSQLSERPQGPNHFEGVKTAFTADQFKGNKASIEADKIVEGAGLSLQLFAQRVANGDRAWGRPLGKGQSFAVFAARFEFQNDDKKANSIEVRYTAEDRYDAICSVIKFWITRQVNIPGHFHRLFSLSINSETFGPIGDDGTLYGGTGLPFFDWKIDADGLPMEMHAIYTIDKIARGRG
jgi:hypothetical protein